MISLEGLKTKAYTCTAGKRTVGIGFNLDANGSRDIWEKLNIEEDFDCVYDNIINISKATAKKLHYYMWEDSKKKAKKRAEELSINFDELPKYHQFILTDLAYNIGSVDEYKLVFKATSPKGILFQARRRPYKLLDNRVARIGHYFNLISSVDEAKQIGLVFTTQIT